MGGERKGDGGRGRGCGFSAQDQRVVGKGGGPKGLTDGMDGMDGMGRRDGDEVGGCASFSL